MYWGKCKENGLWMAAKHQWRLRFFNHDAFYLAMGRLRLRLMKP